MQTRFRALVSVSDEGQLEAIYVPSLQYQLFFSEQPDESALFKRLGPQYYLENKLSEVVAKKQAADENIEDASTMALMTQGFSELSSPSHSYNLYFVEELKQINRDNIDGIGIVIAGTETKRKAYLISNNQFYRVNNQRWELEFELTPDQQSALAKTEFNANAPAKVTILNCAAINELKKQIVLAAGWIYLGSHSYPYDVYINDRTRRPCSLFTKVLPPFMRFTLFLNLGLDVIINLSLLETMPNPFFPPQIINTTNSTMGNSTEIIPNPKARIFNISQVSIASLISLLFIFAGPRQRSVRGLGRQIDDFFIGLYNKIFKKPWKCNTSSFWQCPSWSDLKVRLTKFIFTLLVLDQVALMILMSYLRLSAISDNINQSKDPIFSEEVVKDATLSQWILGQFNDPLLVFSELNMILYLLENFFRPNNMLQSIKEQSKKPQPSHVIDIKAPSLSQNPATQFHHSAASPLLAKEEKTLSHSFN